MRSGPDRSYPTLASVPAGTALTVSARTNDSSWLLVNSDQGQRGWVSARVPAHFHLRKSETRRERLQIINENGKLQVVNGLGAPIKSLWLADENMNVYQAASVAAGQKAGLILSPQSQSAAGSGPNGLLREITYVTRTNALAGTAVKFLTPNSYLAVLDGNPFIENALGSASSPKRMKSSAVVFGILEAPPAQ